MDALGMTGFTSQNRRATPGDPLDDLLDDTSMRASGARARPRVSYARSSAPANVWWFALVASIIWVAAVIAFAWARFSLPGDPRVVFDAAGSRIGFSDWMMILAVIIGPLLLIWVIAWLVRRSLELRDESRRLAKAAILLADAAENAEKRAELMLPAPDSPAGELIAMGPGHLHREIERANHAMSALKTQMSSMEGALAKQAAAFDDAAEKAAQRTKALTAVTAGIGLAATGAVAGAVASGESTEEAATVSPAPEKGSLLEGEVVAGKPAEPAAAVDLSLQAAPAVKADDLRLKLREAGKSAGWKKLTDEQAIPKPVSAATSSAIGAAVQPDFEADAPLASKTSAPLPSAQTARPVSQASLSALREDVAAIKSTPLPSPTTPSGQSIDPFDDLGPSAPKAAIGAAVGAGVATMSFGASRNDEPSDATPSLGAPSLDEPAPAPAFQPKPAPEAEMPKKEDFEFMARALDWNKFVKAANFPENERDTATLDALYDVLTDPEAAALLQSSEDTLATLADIDLYMEDFIPEMSSVAAWQGHLNGKQSVIPIEAPLEQSRIAAKISADEKFRKLSERFIERYRVIAKRLFAEGADKKLAVELSDTRTGRAYLLIADALGRL